MTHASKWFGIAASCALLSACASQQVAAKDLADSEAAVRAATELGAKGTPQAALHLQLAKDRLESAKRYNEKGEGATAKLLLDEAKADAELAVVLTRRALVTASGRAGHPIQSEAAGVPA